MKIMSIQVGLPREVEFNGRTVRTGIFKDPVKGPVQVRYMNLDGDKQADLTVHGGRNKAVYGYSLDTYPWWKENRPADTFEYGAFGENLSIDQILESEVCIGDTFAAGTSILQAVQPRFPCFKLGVKFQDPSIIKTFMKLRRPGVYFRVLQEGVVEEGQELKRISREAIRFSILDLMDAMLHPEADPETLYQILMVKALPEEIRERLSSRR